MGQGPAVYKYMVSVVMDSIVINTLDWIGTFWNFIKVVE